MQCDLEHACGQMERDLSLMRTKLESQIKEAHELRLKLDQRDDALFQLRVKFDQHKARAKFDEISDENVLRATVTCSQTDRQTID